MRCIEVVCRAVNIQRVKCLWSWFGMNKINISAEAEHKSLSLKAASSTIFKVVARLFNKPSIQLKSSNRNIHLSLSVALVCQVSLGKYEYFYVVDTPLVVKDGYFKVRKK